MSKKTAAYWKLKSTAFFRRLNKTLSSRI